MITRKQYPKHHVFETMIGGRPFTVETGKVAELADATRRHPGVELGASPRASLALMQASRAFAYINGRTYVVPEDIVRLIMPVFSHRIVLKQESRVSKRTVGSVLEDVVSSVAPPIKRR